jgi:hypothetical protein
MDLSDEGLSQLAEAIFEMDIVDAVKALRSIRDQARAAERKRTLLWVADQLDGERFWVDWLRRDAEEGGKDA